MAYRQLGVAGSGGALDSGVHSCKVREIFVVDDLPGAPAHIDGGEVMGRWRGGPLQAPPSPPPPVWHGAYPACVVAQCTRISVSSLPSARCTGVRGWVGGWVGGRSVGWVVKWVGGSDRSIWVEMLFNLKGVTQTTEQPVLGGSCRVMMNKQTKMRGAIGVEASRTDLNRLTVLGVVA